MGISTLFRSVMPSCRGPQGAENGRRFNRVSDRRKTERERGNEEASYNYKERPHSQVQEKTQCRNFATCKSLRGYHT